MERFCEVFPGVYLLKVPFGPVWTGVVLITGKENVLIDSGAVDADVDGCIVPALKEMGLGLQDVRFLINTHSHGDHIGGNYRLRQLGKFKLAAYEGTAPKVEDPVPYAIATRTKFPEYSPAPQSFLKGVKVDVMLKDGEILADRLQVLHTPGHDNDCICLLDLPTKTLITGDSLQGNGTICQGVGFYKSLPDYLYTLDKLEKMDIKNILCGHDYDGIGYLIEGRENVKKALSYCRSRVDTYGKFVKAHQHEEPAKIAEALIETHGCGMPERLFMALYTVTEHLTEE